MKADATPSPHHMGLTSYANEVLDRIALIPWFEHVGIQVRPDEVKGHPRDKWSSGWKDWPGPEELRVEHFNTDVTEEEVSLRHVFARRASGLGRFGRKGRRMDKSAKWVEGIERRARTLVEQHAGGKLHYDPNQDPWDPKTFAVRVAIQIGGIVAGYAAVGFASPPEGLLERVWGWYAAGHWPSGYVRQRREGRSEGLLIY